MAGRFNLTPRAKEDLRGIWHYTRKVWSEAQADKYVAAIYSRIQWLAQQPQMGKHRPDIESGFYCFPQGSHLVFYLINDHSIDIIGVPHKEMDILNYFDGGY